jgi:hypothetical protein
MTLPLAGQPGHGRTAFVRRQPVRIVDGRFEGGYTGVFELICPGCGDHPYLDYSEVPPRLQWLRGPRTLQMALVVYDKHLGPSGTNGDSAGTLESWHRDGQADGVHPAYIPRPATNGGSRLHLAAVGDEPATSDRRT